MFYKIKITMLCQFTSEPTHVMFFAQYKKAGGVSQ